MEGSYFNRLWAFKSRIRVVAASLYQSRETLRQRCRRWRNEIVRLRCQIQEQHREIVQRDQQIEESRVKLAELAARIQQLQKRPLVWPSDPRLPCHQYGPKMISLCIRLARRIGLRATPCCLTILFEHLGVRESIPDWTTIRQWMLRAGVALLEEPLERADDWILFVDHSNQIGQEKLLVIEGLRESQLPPPGHALTHEHLRVLTVQLGVSWKTEDMARVYEALAAKIGNPRALVIDGASELRDAAKVFQKGDSKTIILGDFKHFAANLLKKVLGRTERFQEFKQQMGTSRSTIQQTELGHFTPPGLKSKARFMNLQPTLKWALMILWQLAHPASRARQGISEARMNEKLGWIAAYEADLRIWGSCQDVISRSLTFINEQGLTPQTAGQLKTLLKPLATCQTSRTVATELIKFVKQSATALRPGQRLPMSTEILESSFGVFKQLEGQHSKGGFTSLIAAFPVALRSVTPESIRRDFARVSTRQTKEWIRKHLATTLASKRTTAYNEFKTQTVTTKQAG